MLSVRLRHKDKTAECLFFAMPGDGSALLGMPDIEVLDILKITCEVMGDLYKSRMFDCQMIQPCNSPSCKANKVQQIKAGLRSSDQTLHRGPTLNKILLRLEGLQYLK